MYYHWIRYYNALTNNKANFRCCIHQIQYNSEVTGARQTADGAWTLRTPGGDVRAHNVINAAGLYGDHVEKLTGNTPPFT